MKVGTVCIDTYEASVWQIDPIANPSLVKKVQAGKATLADLRGIGTVANPPSPKGTQLSPAPLCVPSYPQNFPPDGNWLPAWRSAQPAASRSRTRRRRVSTPYPSRGWSPVPASPGSRRTRRVSCRAKHLLTNVEWQGAAAGTPDPGTDNGTSDCAIASGVVKTGSRSKCQSSWGVFDMVGNLEEWVADWADRANVGCTDWTSQTGIAGHDTSCFGGNGMGAFNQIPAALARGGGFSASTAAGVFAVDAHADPSFSAVFRGFRCAR